MALQLLYFAAANERVGVDGFQALIGAASDIQPGSAGQRGQLFQRIFNGEAAAFDGVFGFCANHKGPFGGGLRGVLIDIGGNVYILRDSWLH